MSSPVETIKEKLSITDVVGSYLKLERAGVNLRARCPFHNEKPPSFFVSPGRGSFYCFGCGAKGDIFSFVEQFEGVDFKGALKTLAERAGVPLARENPKARDEREKLFSAMVEAAEFYEKNLASAEKPLSYLKDRGLQEKIIKEFRLGYAPPGWQNLRNFMRERGRSDKELLSAGLIKPSKDGTFKEEEYYDAFRGRIIFPISDSVGRIVAFSARAFDDPEEPPKYINSPETPIFRKSEILYGYDKAKQYIRKTNFCILVEGQTDLLMAHQAGYRNAAALSGTALSGAHLRSIKRMTDRLVIAFDADGAGIKAALRSVGEALSLGMDIKIAALPSGEDPASVIGKDKNLWVAAVKNSKHVVDFLLDSIKNAGYDNRKFKLEVERQVLPFVRKIESAIDQAHFAGKVASAIGASEDTVWQAIRSKEEEPEPVSAEDGGGKKAEEPKEDKLGSIERRIAGILAWQEGLASPQTDTQRIRERFMEIAGREIDKISSGQSAEYAFEAEIFYEDGGTIEKELLELFKNFEDNFIKDKLEKMAISLRQAEKDGKDGEAKAILSDYHALSKRLNSLRVEKEKA